MKTTSFYCIFTRVRSGRMLIAGSSQATDVLLLVIQYQCRRQEMSNRIPFFIFIFLSFWKVPGPHVLCNNNDFL